MLSWRPGMGPESMAATARRLHPDLIIDAGLVTPERAAFADQVQQLALHVGEAERLSEGRQVPPLMKVPWITLLKVLESLKERLGSTR